MRSLTLSVVLALVAVPALADKRTDDAVARAEDQIKKGRPDEALKTVQKLVQQAPGPEAYLALARVQQRVGGTEDPLPSLLKAAEAAGAASPEVKSDVLAGVSALELSLGANKEATAHAQAAVQASPTPAAHAAVARAHAASFQSAAALEAADRAVQAGATSAIAHLARAEALLQAGRAPDAAAASQKALELDPKLTLARVRLAAALLAQGKAAEAEAEAKKATEADPQLGEGFSTYGRAILAVDAKRWNDAISQAQQGAFLAPKNAAVQVDVGRIFEAGNNLDQAVAAYKRALEAAPGYGPARLALVSAQIRRGEVDAVIPQLEQLAKEMPENGDVQLQLGRVLLRKGDFAAALGPLEKAAAALPGNAEAHAFLGTADQYNGKPAEALLHYKKAVELNSSNADYRTTYGLLLGINKQYEQGIAELKKVTATPGYKDPDGFINLGWLNRSVEPARSAEAVAAYKRALELDPKNPHASVGLGWAYSSGKSWSDAIAAFNSAAQIEPKNAGQAYNGIAWAYLLQKDFAKAKDFKGKAETAGRNDVRLTETLDRIEKAVAAGKAAEADRELADAERRRQRAAATEDTSEADDFDSLVQRLAYGNNGGARRTAATKLATFGAKAVNSLIRALDDSDRGVRIAAARSLGQIGSAAKSAVPHLRRSAEPVGGIYPTEADQKINEANKPFRDAIRDALLKIG